MADEKVRVKKAKTGVPGLDDVLSGGLAPGHVFLLEGEPGTGKTTIALRFLLEGAEAGEKCLYITLSETEQELREGAASHGWTIGANIVVSELAPAESLLDSDEQQTLLYSSELELDEAIKKIFEAFERAKPSWVVLDSLSEIRLLAQSSLRYRRQILALKHYFARHGATVLLLDDRTSEANDKTPHSIVHGVIQLQELAPDYGAERRRLRVSKYRGQAFRGGYHDFAITTGGVSVFPRLVAAEHRAVFARSLLVSGLAELDALLGGGIERGSSTLILGPAGTGKSTFALQFVFAACKRGEKAAVFVFDEELGLLFDRAKVLGFDLEGLRDSGALHIEQLDAAELSPGEFAHRVRRRVRYRRGGHRRDRQPQRLSGRDARGEFPHSPHARVDPVHEPAGHKYLSDSSAAWPGRRHEGSDRCHVPGRYGHSAALFRGLGQSQARCFRHQETNGEARRHDPGIPHQRQGTRLRRTARRISGCASRRTNLCGKGRSLVE